MERIHGNWGNITSFQGVKFLCGYCNSIASPSNGYHLIEKVNYNSSPSINAYIYICPNCNRPTLKIYGSDQQYPGPKLGQTISFLPEDIEQLYNEVRDCISVNAFTSAVLSARKILMNTAVSKGAEEGKRFAFYVSFLQDHHFIPPRILVVRALSDRISSWSGQLKILSDSYRKVIASRLPHSCSCFTCSTRCTGEARW